MVKPCHGQVQWQLWKVGVPNRRAPQKPAAHNFGLILLPPTWCFRESLSNSLGRSGYQTCLKFLCVFLLLFACLLLWLLSIASIAMIPAHKERCKPLLCCGETSCFHLDSIQRVQNGSEWIWRGVTHVVFPGGSEPSKEAVADRACGYLQPLRSLAIPRAWARLFLGRSVWKLAFISAGRAVPKSAWLS